jgi:CBS domain containing-hemolysin-like protein
MERPIAAILIINTAANTAGAAVAGAQARVLFGESALIWFSLLFTFAVLFISEIIPKVVGVVHNRSAATLVARPWNLSIKLLFPLIWLTQHVARLLKPSDPVIASEEEVHHFAMMSAEEGSIMQHEADMVTNVLHLDRVKTRELMTPRPVVFKLASGTTLGDLSHGVTEWNHSRVPVYDARDPDTWKGFVFARDVLAALAADRHDATIDQFCKPLFFVTEDTPGHVLLRTFLKRRTHLFGVVDGYGGISGIVTLEDVLESLIGEEIVDESDSAVDMQEVARRRKKEIYREMEARGTIVDDPESDENS